MTTGLPPLPPLDSLQPDTSRPADDSAEREAVQRFIEAKHARGESVGGRCMRGFDSDAGGYACANPAAPYSQFCNSCEALSRKGLSNGKPSVPEPVPVPGPRDGNGNRNSTNAPTFDIRPWPDFAEEAGKEVRYTVDGLLLEGGMSILGSPPKAGKSTLARCMSAAIAGAKDEVLGRRVNEHGPTLYFNLEGPPSIAFEHMEQIDPEGRVQFVLQSQDMPEPNARAVALEQAIISAKPRLVVIDTLSKFMTGVDDLNDYSMVSRALGQYDAMLSEHSTHIVWIHHTGKAVAGVARRHGAELLGSTALAGAVDTVLIMNRMGEQRQIYSTNRAGDPLPHTVLQLVDGWQLPVGERTAIESATLQDRVLAYLHDAGGWVPLATCKQDIEGRNARIVKALAKLLEVGLVDRRKEGRSLIYCCSRVPDIGTGTGTVRETTLIEQ